MVKRKKKVSKANAILALVCGIVGITTAFIPYLCIIFFPAEIIAVISGIIGIKRKGKLGMAITGLILGVTAIPLTITFITAYHVMPNLKNSIKEKTYCNSAAYCDNTCINGKRTCYYYENSYDDGFKEVECDCYD